jgi:sugar O-acyltransferase (sialic acid O-acetyltransferase NeuD family)
MIHVVGMGGFGREVAEYLCMSHPDRPITWVDDHNKAATFNTDADFRGRAAVVAIGDPFVRSRLFDKLEERGALLPNLNLLAIVRSRMTEWKGIVICPQSVVTAGVTLGRGVQINLHVTVGHDAEIGDFSTLCPNVNIGGHAHIGRHVFIGTGAVVLPRVKVGDRAVIGAGSIVNRDVPNGATVVGNPARVLRTVG